MRYRGAFGFLGALLILGIVGTLMALSYGAGAASSGAVVAASDGRRFFGFLFLVFIVVMIFGLVGAGHRGHRHSAWDGPGYVGPGEWHGHGHWRNDEWAESRKAALNEWHREAHAGQDPAAGDTSGDAASGPMRGPQP
jgi:hypothetical protein